MIAIQLVSAHIGRVTGKGIAANAKEHHHTFIVFILVSLLLAANIFNIAADIAAMGEALYLVVGGLKHEHALIFAGGSVLLQVFVPYSRYARYLKWLTLVLLCYVGVIFTVEIPWRKVVVSTLWPTFSISSDYLMMHCCRSRDDHKSLSFFLASVAGSRRDGSRVCATTT
jgi:Mn2+/Fe2+ NRAMP family transporter